MLYHFVILADQAQVDGDPDYSPQSACIFDLSRAAVDIRFALTSVEVPSTARCISGSQTPVRETSGYSGMFPCFLRGIVSPLFASIRKARITFGRVSCGSITSSI
jgi:hypothetical protein